jgi:hypothetical protein
LRDAYGLQNSCGDNTALVPLVRGVGSVTGGLPSSYFYTHKHVFVCVRICVFVYTYVCVYIHCIQTHMYTYTQSCTSVFKGCAFAAFLSPQRLCFDLCPVSVTSEMVEGAFGEFFFLFEYLGFLLLLPHAYLHLNKSRRLSEGQASESVEPSRKQCCFG